MVQRRRKSGTTGKKTFNDYITAYVVVGEVNKLDVLTILWYTVCRHIECQTHDDPVSVLGSLFIKGLK